MSFGFILPKKEMRDMRRKVLVALIAFMFLFGGIANATVFNWGEGDLFRALKAVFGTTSDGHSHDGTNSRSLGTSTTNPTFATNIVAAGAKEGLTVNVSTESSLTSAALAYGVINLEAGSAKTIGIDNGVPGQMVTIYMSVYDGGNITISSTGSPNSGPATDWTSIVFSAVGQRVTLLYLDTTYGWVVLGVPTAGVFHTLSTTSTIIAGTSVAAGTTVTGGTGVSATTGDVTADAGDVVATLGAVDAATTVTGGTGVTATTGDVTAATGQCLFQTDVVASGFREGVTTNVSTESSLTSAALAYGYIKMEAGSTKTIGLTDGVPGQMLTVTCSVYDGGDIVIDKTGAVTTTTTTGWSTITLNTSGDIVTLLFLDASSGWIVIYNSGCTIA